MTAPFHWLTAWIGAGNLDHPLALAAILLCLLWVTAAVYLAGVAASAPTIGEEDER